MACKVSLQSSLATLIAISVANSGNGSVQVAGRCIAYVRPATRIPSTLLHLVPMPAWEQRKLGEIAVVPEFLRTLVFARPRGDDQFADCTFSPSLDMSR